MPTETSRTYVTCDDGNTYLIDTIEHEGALWLVPKWSATTFPSMYRPERIIRLPKERLQDHGPDFLGSGIRARTLSGLVPKAVLDGESGSQSSWPPGVVEAPDLVVRR